MFWNWFRIPLPHIRLLHNWRPNAVHLTDVALRLFCMHNMLIFETHLLSLQSYFLPSSSPSIVLERSIWSFRTCNFCLYPSPFPFSSFSQWPLLLFGNHACKALFLLKASVNTKLLPCLVFYTVFILPANIFPLL